MTLAILIIAYLVAIIGVVRRPEKPGLDALTIIILVLLTAGLVAGFIKDHNDKISESSLALERENYAKKITEAGELNTKRLMESGERHAIETAELVGKIRDQFVAYSQRIEIEKRNTTNPDSKQGLDNLQKKIDKETPPAPLWFVTLAIDEDADRETVIRNYTKVLSSEPFFKNNPALKTKAYVRKNGLRWAAGVGDPMAQEEAQQLLNRLAHAGYKQLDRIPFAEWKLAPDI